MNAFLSVLAADDSATGIVQALPPALAAVATLLGLTYLAYRHPHMYRRMHLWFLGASILILLALIIHNAGIDLTFRELNDLIVADARTEAKARVDKMRFPFNYVLVAFSGVVAYLFFLLYLRRLLRRDRASASSADDAPRPRPTPQPKGSETLAREEAGAAAASKKAEPDDADHGDGEDDGGEANDEPAPKKKTRRRKKKGG